VRRREAENLRLKHGGHGFLLCTLPSGMDIFDIFGAPRLYSCGSYGSWHEEEAGDFTAVEAGRVKPGTLHFLWAGDLRQLLGRSSPFPAYPTVPAKMQRVRDEEPCRRWCDAAR
jgi:hypothetical protein